MDNFTPSVFFIKIDIFQHYYPLSVIHYQLSITSLVPTATTSSNPSQNTRRDSSVFYNRTSNFGHKHDLDSGIFYGDANHV